jgi:hypothetical protein
VRGETQWRYEKSGEPFVPYTGAPSVGVAYYLSAQFAGGTPAVVQPTTATVFYYDGAGWWRCEKVAGRVELGSVAVGRAASGGSGYRESDPS